MPWFYCDSCGDTIKKPKIAAHLRHCAGSTFTCIDCSASFDIYSVHSHTTCVTEKQKYIDGATKPGDFASNGFSPSSAPDQTIQDPVGTEYLTTHPPWRCNLCEIFCINQKTLMGHAAGAAHKRKVKRAAQEAELQKVEEPVEEISKFPEMKKVEKDPDHKHRRKLQAELGIQILRKHGYRLSTKKFLKKFQKRTLDKPELAQNILKRMKKLPYIEVTDSVLHLQIPKQ